MSSTPVPPRGIQPSATLGAVTTATDTRPGTHRVWWIVPALLLGLLWMHGTAAHGGAAHPEPPEPAGPQPAAATPSGSGVAVDVSLPHQPVAGAVADAVPHGPGGHTLDLLAGICLALLAAVAAGLRRGTSAGRFEGLVPRPRRTSVRRSVWQVPTPDPVAWGLLRC